MKKILYAALMLLVMGFAACENNDDDDFTAKPESELDTVNDYSGTYKCEMGYMYDNPYYYAHYGTQRYDYFEDDFEIKLYKNESGTYNVWYGPNCTLKDGGYTLSFTKDGLVNGVLPIRHWKDRDKDTWNNTLFKGTVGCVFDMGGVIRGSLDGEVEYWPSPPNTGQFGDMMTIEYGFVKLTRMD